MTDEVSLCLIDLIDGRAHHPTDGRVRLTAALDDVTGKARARVLALARSSGQARLRRRAAVVPDDRHLVARVEVPGLSASSGFLTNSVMLVREKVLDVRCLFTLTIVV
jgi:hypothetical protein